MPWPRLWAWTPGNTVPLMAAALLTGLAPMAAAAAVPCVGMAGQEPPGHALQAVAVVSPCNVWAAGDTGPNLQSEIVHWDGASWAVTPAPSDARQYDVTSLQARTASDIWAVGTVNEGAGSQAVIEHWDGTSWSFSPITAHLPNESLQAVTATSPTNAWAVGSAKPDGHAAPLIEHWNGTSWTPMPNVPSPGDGFPIITGIAAVSASDAWVLGATITVKPVRLTGFAMHWNGASWQVTSTGDATAMVSVTAISASNAWAVGAGPDGPLAEHWDGSSWTPMPLPSGDGNASLAGVTATSATDVWAVGSTAPLGVRHVLIEHWDGTSWTVVPGPDLGDLGIALSGVAAGAAGNVWAVGSRLFNGDSQATALRLRAG